MSGSGSYSSRSFYLNVFLFTRKVSFILMFLFVKGWDADRETLELAFLMTKIFSGFDLLTSIGMVVSSCMMVYGIKKEKERFLLPAIYYIPVDGLFRFVLQKFNAIDIKNGTYIKQDHISIYKVISYLPSIKGRSPKLQFLLVNVH